MGYSIELYFESTFENTIRILWDALAQAGVPSFYQRMKGRPHLTLAVCEHINETQLAALLHTFSQTVPQLMVNFPAIALIPGHQSVVYLPPIVTTPLRDIHAALYNVLQESGNPPVEHYTPEVWLPHSPISKELSLADAIKTVEICSTSQILGSTHMIELGLIKIRPSRPLQIWPLGRSEHHGQETP